MNHSPHRFRHFLVTISFVLAAFVGVFATSNLTADVLYTGTNLAGADFGEGNLPGIYNTHYTYPTPQEVGLLRREGYEYLSDPLSLGATSTISKCFA